MAKKQTDISDFQELFKEAAEIASVVPESMQEAAFFKAVELLYANETTTTKKVSQSKTKSPSNTSEKSKNDTEERYSLLEKKINRTKYQQVTPQLTVLEQSLYVLLAAKNDAGIDRLTPTEIAKLLTDKFSIPTTRNAVNAAFNRNPHLTDRYSEERGYSYKIMQSGENYLSMKEKDISKQQKKKSITRTKKQKTGTSNKTKTPKYGRPGPKAMLLALLSEGFFNTGKTIGEINSYLESQKGYAYTTSELSPPLIRLVREEIITRVKNDQNQYEYSAPNS